MSKKCLTYYISTIILSAPIFYFSPFVGYISHVLILITSYLIIGGSYWKGEDTLIISPKELFNSLRKKDVMIIESSSIDDFKITLISEDDEDLISEQNNHKKMNDSSDNEAA